MQRNVYEGHMAIRFHKSCDDSIAEKDKMNPVECSDYRTISLISHASKILLKILTNKIEAKARDFIWRNQFGFKMLLYERCNWSHENDMREESGIWK